MEERLFWIGISMGVYAWATKQGTRTGWLDDRKATSLWHALFCAIAGFSVALIVVMSMESRARFQSITVGLLSTRELYTGLVAGAALGVWGLWRAYSDGKTTEGRKYFHSEDLEWAETIFSAILLAAVMMYFVIQAFKIPSGSMRSTLLEGDHLFVNKFIYGVRIPFTHKRVVKLKPIERRDVIVFRFPSGDPQEIHCGGIQYGKDFIKRVIGLPGEEVKVADGRVFVDGKTLEPEPYAQYLDMMHQSAGVPPTLGAEQYQKLWETHRLDQTMGDIMKDNFGPIRVPPNTYFVMGDNRDRSCDSRFWGPVEEYNIKGKAWAVYWPPSRIGAVGASKPDHRDTP